MSGQTRCLIPCLIVAALLCGGRSVAAAKLAVPDSDARKKASQIIDEVFGDDIRAADTVKKKAELAPQLLKNAEDLNDDPAGQYVLLQKAGALAVAGGDPDAAFGVIDAIDERFDVDANAMRASVFKSIADKVRSDDQRNALANYAVNMATELMAAKQYARAKELADKGAEVAKKVSREERDTDLITQLLQLGRKIGVYEREYDKIKAAEEKLKSDPLDAEANAIVGKFRCFIEEDWAAGVPMSALSDATDLKAAAELELGAPKKPEDQLKVGDAWWDLSDVEQGDLKGKFRRRAGHWYEKAKNGGLSGLGAKKAEKRLDELAKADVSEAPTKTKSKSKKKSAVKDKWLASASEDGSIRIWDVETGAVKHKLVGTAGYVYCIGYSPNGKLLASGGADGVVRIWDVTTGRGLRKFKAHSSYIKKVGYTANGANIVSVASDGLRTWSASSGAPVRAFTNLYSTYNLAISPNGAKLACGSSSVYVYDAASMARIGRLEHESSIRSIAFSPNNRVIATGGYAKTVNLWDTGNSKGMPGHTSTITSVAFSPDGRKLVSASYDGTARIWDIGKLTTEFTLAGHSGTVTTAVFSPSGEHVATGGYDDKVIVWDAKTGKPVHTLTGHSDSIKAVAFAPRAEW